MTEKPKTLEFVGKTSLVLAGLLGLTAVNNLEIVDAVHSQLTYQEPEDGDIIPERTGCEKLNIELRGSAGEMRVSADYAPEQDAILRDVSDKRSGAHRFGESVEVSTETPFKMTPILSLTESYFDRVTSRGQTDFGANVEVLRNENGRAFAFNIEELNQLPELVFGNLDIYQKPEIRAIMECKKREVLNDGYFENKEIRILVAPGDNTFIRNFSIGEYTDKIADRNHLAGLGSPNVRINLPPFISTPDHYMIITGINRGEDGINQRVLHEWIHLFLFQDLSDTISEIDEQERNTQYVEKAIIDNLRANNKELPKFISLLDESIGEASPDLGQSDFMELKLKIGMYAVQILLASTAIGAVTTFGKRALRFKQRHAR